MKKRRHHWGRDLMHEPEYLSMAIDTPCICSCWMCGNKRRAYGRTMQERRSDEEFFDDLIEDNDD